MTVTSSFWICAGTDLPASDSRVPGADADDCTSQQRNTHIGELREIHYPWHPWHDRKVRVHATLVKRGQAVARCSLEDVQPFRIVEVPLWMLDAAACCKIQASKCKVANVESLRELKALLQPTRRIDLEFAIQTQHPCLLDAGGADVSVIEPTEVHPTRAVCSPESNTGLAGTIPRGATEGSATAGDAAAATRRKTERHTGGGDAR
jgi:hypothetical protein